MITKGHANCLLRDILLCSILKRKRDVTVCLQCKNILQLIEVRPRFASIRTFRLMTQMLKSFRVRGCRLCADASVLFLFPILAEGPILKNLAKHTRRHKGVSVP
jgi:hypothetical protein